MSGHGRYKFEVQVTTIRNIIVSCECDLYSVEKLLYYGKKLENKVDNRIKNRQLKWTFES